MAVPCAVRRLTSVRASVCFPTLNVEAKRWGLGALQSAPQLRERLLLRIETWAWNDEVGSKPVIRFAARERPFLARKSNSGLSFQHSNEHMLGLYVLTIGHVSLPLDPNPIDLQRAWEAEYASSLYLREAHPQMLADRYDNLIQNLWSTDRDGNVQKPRHPDRRMHVLRLIFHVIQEQTRRGNPPPSGKFDEQAMIDEATSTYEPPRMTSRIVGGADGFSKYGKRDHMRASFERGVFRIAPASSYDDPSLNVAQADKELEHFTVTPNERLLFKLHGTDANGKEIEFEPKPIQLFRYMNVSDFYVWCCGYSCDVRMFHDFQADALLFVKDCDAFTKRMLEAVKKARPGSMPVHGPVEYYDPYTVQRNQLRPVFSKNLKYLYQNEYRFAWNVPPGTRLDAFFVELGPLNDIAEFYETT